MNIDGFISNHQKQIQLDDLLISSIGTAAGWVIVIQLILTHF